MDVSNKNSLVAIVGRPNVGKSTLFNMLLKKRVAITHYTAGVTHDVVSAECEYKDYKFTIQDTGGITDEGTFAKLIKEQSLKALHEASVIVFVVSVEELTAEDDVIAKILRRVSVPVILVANKADNESKAWQASELYSLGLGEALCISALHKINLEMLCESICKYIPKQERLTNDEQLQDFELDNEQDSNAIETIIKSKLQIQNSQEAIRLLVLGKPNTGKSSLINCIAQTDCMVSDIPGTTRDIAKEPFTYNGKSYVLIDSAGVRRKNRIKDDVEYYSIHRAIDAIDESDVVLLLTSVKQESDGEGQHEQFSEQDKKLISLVIRKAKALIIGINKWDLLKVKENRLQAEKDRIHFLLPQMSYAPIVPLSAKNAFGIEHLFETVQRVYSQLFIDIPTPQLNRELKKWLGHKMPPLMKGKKRRGSIKFISQVANNPVVFKVYVNNIKLFPKTYLKYIENCIRKTYELTEVPFHIIFSTRGD